MTLTRTVSPPNLPVKCTEALWGFVECSLGIVLWELATGQVPERGNTPLPAPSERCPTELIALIRDCTVEDARLRPSAKEVHDRILRIQPMLEV